MGICYQVTCLLRADIEHISNSVYTHIVMYTNSSVVDPVIYTTITKLLVFFCLLVMIAS